MNWEQIKTALHEEFNERGITNPNFRIKITGREIIGHSDWAWLYIDIYEPRKKTPCQSRKLAFNFVKHLINWEKSEFYNLR